MNKIKIEDNVICIENIKTTLKNSVMQYKINGDRIFVLLDIPQNKELNYDDCHNLYCYNLKGKEMWQIGKRSKGDDTVFTMINIIDSVLYANDFHGRRFSVNQENGKIGSMSITK